MKLRRLFASLVALLFISISIAQDASVEKSKMAILGDRSYDNGDYFLAAEYYKKSLEKNEEDHYSAYMLAECSRGFFDYDAAEKYYEVAAKKGGDLYPLANFYHALMMKTNGKYRPAADKFELFIAAYTPQDENDKFGEQAVLQLNGCVLAMEELKRPQRDFTFRIEGQPVNTEYSDYAAVIFKNDSNIVITSARKTSEDDEEYKVLGGAFNDNFWLDKSTGSWAVTTEDADEFDFKELNTRYNDGAGVFNPAKDKYYFTICGEEVDESNQVTCAIYVSKMDGKRWSDPKRLNDNINMKGHWNAQPSLSLSGDTMFFVSKRPGGYGRHDLWMSILEDPLQPESWGEPQNMGPEINTPGIDLSPFYYSEEDVLFFASDGHEGFGGLDIFMAKNMGKDPVRNIGLPFNSNRDDFYFVLGDRRGYLASNREGGYGNDDIYGFNIQSKETVVAELASDTLGSELITIKGRIMDDDGAPAPDVAVMLADQDDNVLKMTTTDENGVFIFANLDPGIDYKVMLEDEDASQLTTYVNYKLDDIEIFAASEFDAQAKEPEVTEPEVTEPEITEPEVTEPEVTEPEVTEPVVTARPSGRTVLENIYYDYDKSKLRREARKTLDEVADFVKDNPSIKLEMKAFTDSRGSDDYNVSLARRRGQAAYDYLVNRGVPRSTIIVDAVGEASPIASNTNEVGRALNRRVEFYVVGGGGYESKGKAYVVTRPTSLDELADQFSMSVTELKELNDISGGNIAAYKVVRVRRIGDESIIEQSTLQMAGQRPESFSSSSDYSGSSGDFVTFDNTSYNQGVKYRKYDGSGYYVVLPRNTLFSIAQVTGTSVEEIKRLNGLRGNTIFVGQKLKVNSNPSARPEEIDNVQALYDAGTNVQDQQGETVMIGDDKRYIVKEGDTFFSICDEYGLMFEELRVMNGMDSYVVRPGMPLRVERTDQELEARNRLEEEMQNRPLNLPPEEADSTMTQSPVEGIEE